ncbi:MAG: DUF1428 domain-containing protein [Luteimonas sp.]|nr:DUF1428 domain-containing protein [Luteimonas sp.]
MTRYVEGFLLAVPAKNLAAYRRISRKAGKVWMEYGALQYVECVADDLQPGEVVSFAKAVQLKRGEVALFSFIAYRSRAHRDRVNKKVMADPRIAGMGPDACPFDPKRMMWGGFKAIVSL